VRVTEVRSAGFLGPGPVGPYAYFVAPAVLAGQEASWPGDLDAPHSWNYTEDIARTLVAASRTERAWGRAWHVPATSSVSVRVLSERLAELAGVASPRLRRLHREDLVELSRTQPVFGELLEMLYSNENPHVLDSALTEEVLGVRATPLDVVVNRTLAGERGRR
jgi:nucleoside-diphosphate-sugar epimerase